MGNCVPEPSRVLSGSSQTSKLSLKERFFGRVPVAVAKSLRDDPRSWKSDEKSMGRPFTLTHSSGVQLWVANGSYGMDVKTGWSGRKVWGGVSLLSMLHISPGHLYLRHAAGRWLTKDDDGRDSVGEVLTSLRVESR